MRDAATALARQGASVEEVAAALAAIERHIRARAAPVSRAHAAEPWARAARLAAVGENDVQRGWADPHPWGRQPR